VVDEIPDCTYPPTPRTDDERWRKFYDRLAPLYDWSERVLGKLVTGVDMVVARAEVMSFVPAKPGESILEVSPGPGVYQQALAAKVGVDGCLWAMDISRGMLEQCRKNCKRQLPSPKLVQGNAAYLPFPDKSFDGLFHFGGVNLFAEPDKALREFARVVRPDGWVVFGDEQFSPAWRARSGLRASILRRVNPGFLRTPPALPTSLRRIALYEVMDGLCYLQVCRVPV
jgi:ubiquinone/menaquinone biosynthesis C-methylase UbiE